MWAITLTAETYARMRVTLIKECFSPKFESNVLFCVVTFIPRYMMPSAAECYIAGRLGAHFGLAAPVSCPIDDAREEFQFAPVTATPRGAASRHTRPGPRNKTTDSGKGSRLSYSADLQGIIKTINSPPE